MTIADWHSRCSGAGSLFPFATTNQWLYAKDMFS